PGAAAPGGPAAGEGHAPLRRADGDGADQRPGVGRVETENHLEAYLRIHRWMCTAKALDDRMHMLVRQGRAPFVGSARGHEGIQVASTAALGPEDSLGPPLPGLANSIVRGLTMKEWMLAVFAKADDPLSAGR